MPDDQPAFGDALQAHDELGLDPLVRAAARGTPLDVPTLLRAITHREVEMELIAREIGILEDARARLRGDGQV